MESRWMNRKKIEENNEAYNQENLTLNDGTKKIKLILNQYNIKG